MSERSNKRRREAPSSSEEDEEPIVELSSQQRLPAEGEPVCVVCGRYGAYICDIYEVDICSLECKATHKQLKSSKATVLERVERRDVVTKLSVEQRLALPDEAKCLNCSIKLGVMELLERGKVCSRECKGYFLTSDNILQSPLFKHPKIHKTQLLQFRREHNIQVMSGDAPPIIKDFTCLNSRILSNTPLLETPNPVQSQAIPVILDGSDLLLGHVGVGKTMSYLLPLVHRLRVWSQHIADNEIFAVILTPTRDIAVQIEKQTKELCEGIPDMKTALVIGGQSSAQQYYRLHTGAQIVVATPGRLLELNPDLSLCFTLVLEECETLLDRSFHEQVKTVMRLLPPRHQTIMLTSTVTDSLLQFARPLLYHPVVLQVGALQVEGVRQIVIWVEDSAKKRKLLDILKDSRYNSGPVLVFVESRFGALLLADHLLNQDVLCAVIHGEKNQEERNKIINDLSEGRVSVLVSTGLLGHGLHFPSVSVVVVVDMPGSVGALVQQVGRARVPNKKGTAFVFVNETNKQQFLELHKLAVRSGFVLPNQLKNSRYLHYQMQSEESK